MPVRKFLSRIRAKLGDLWWYTILLFVAQRFGDVINMFVGLWIVPKYVPMEELGAVLPLTSVVSLIGIPLSIVAIPFLKFVAVMMERGRWARRRRSFGIPLSPQACFPFFRFSSHASSFRFSLSVFGSKTAVWLFCWL